MSGPRRAILRSLVARSVDIVDGSGFATAELLSDPEVGGFPPQSVRRAIADLERAGLVAREVNGRRVYRIGITEEGRCAASERGLLPGSTDSTGQYPGAFESHDRRVLIAAGNAMCARLQEWAATVDLDKSPDRIRLDFFQSLLPVIVGPPPTPDELALAVVHANALSDALLGAYRSRGTEIEVALVESSMSTVVELTKNIGAISEAVRQRRSLSVPGSFNLDTPEDVRSGS